MYNHYVVTICKTPSYSLKLRDLIEPWKDHIVVKIERLDKRDQIK